MTQDEQVYRQDRSMAAVGVVAGLLSALVGGVAFPLDGWNPSFIVAATGTMTAFFLARQWRTLTVKIELEQERLSCEKQA